MRPAWKQRLSCVAVALSATLGLVTVGSPAGAGPGAGTQSVGAAFALVNLKSGMCLEVAGRSLLDNAPLVQNTCRPNSTNVTDFNQNWLPVSAGSGLVNLVNLNSMMCMDVASAVRGHNVKHHVCNGGINQKWQLVVGEVPGFIRVVSANHARGDFCLDNGDTLIPGAVSIIWTCEAGNINQLWRQA